MTDENRTNEKTLAKMTLTELHELAKERNIKNTKKLKKQEIINELLDLERVLTRKVEVKTASSPLEISPRRRPMAPLAYGEPEKVDEEKVVDEETKVEDTVAPEETLTEEAEERPRETEQTEAPEHRIARESGEFRKGWESETSTTFGTREAAPRSPQDYHEGGGRSGSDSVQYRTDQSRPDARQERADRTSRGKRGAPSHSQPHVAEESVMRGILDIHPDGTYGFMRQKEFKLGEEDIYVSISQIRKFGLRTGDMVEGAVRPPRDQEKYKSLIRIDKINGAQPDENRELVPFSKLVPIYPDQRLFLEMDEMEISTRLIDLFVPIGRGQRGIIVAKPKAGKTVMLKKIAASIAHNHPDIELIALLIDERPEEVTDFERNIDGLVISSTFDEKPENHIQTAELTIEYAKRLVEQGRDVMILLDSLTRLARAYNLTCPPSGKTLSGGLDPNSLYKPKRFLGAARNIENGGSLTIISSALIETGSRLDDIIYEEFKGTANSEIHLIRELADKRIFPAIDLLKSGTRHEELLYNAEEMECLWQLRKMIADMEESERMSRLINKLVKTKSNVELLLQVKKAVDAGS